MGIFYHKAYTTDFRNVKEMFGSLISQSKSTVKLFHDALW